MMHIFRSDWIKDSHFSFVVLTSCDIKEISFFNYLNLEDHIVTSLFEIPKEMELSFNKTLRWIDHVTESNAVSHIENEILIGPTVPTCQASEFLLLRHGYYSPNI